MSDGGIPTVNNPLRVPPLLSAIDGPQEGLPRTVHPHVGVAVGRPQTEVERAMDRRAFATEGYVEVPEDGAYEDETGTRFAYPKGHKLHPAVAARFPALRALAEESPLPTAATPARAGDEVPDLAPTTLEERGLPAAPQNRMEPAPVNRTSRRRSTRSSDGTGSEGNSEGGDGDGE